MEDIRPVVKPDASRLLTKISRFLAKEGIASYLVGGFVRDMLLGRDTADIDIAVDADALAVAAGVAAALGGKYVPLDAENGVGRVVLPDTKWQIDFTTLQGDIGQDLARRDFTIDAMAMELNKSVGKVFDIGNLIDPFNGRDDLRRGMLRAVSDTVFAADAVRLLRAVRIAAELGFSIDSVTETLIRQHSRLITQRRRGKGQGRAAAAAGFTRRRKAAGLPGRAGAAHRPDTGTGSGHGVSTSPGCMSGTFSTIRYRPWRPSSSCCGRGPGNTPVRISWHAVPWSEAEPALRPGDKPAAAREGRCSNWRRCFTTSPNPGRKLPMTTAGRVFWDTRRKAPPMPPLYGETEVQQPRDTARGAPGKIPPQADPDEP